ncbi:hypothetical protein ERO13_D04G084632v2 [Gossypium hirsutum]|uniref:Uncharacterized protein n=1 Tax=Gossypium tomentosum TaxID=34277 RepID=A0A5D2LCQ3_GOSTO|nr:hypothetical protein ERO13_D04G084632v2 [Gossypium hirsutum]TYH76800.1 hypothetical protein ES332_D04G111400v1 [Gossypium tomentosum]
MGEVVSTIPTSKRHFFELFFCSKHPKGLSFYHLLPSPWRWRKGFSFHFFYSSCFFFWIPLQLRCKI